MDVGDTFVRYDLSIDPASKVITSSDASIADEIEDLNKMHRAIVGLSTPNSVPAPPQAVNPTRTMQITKLRESGNASFKKGLLSEAVKMYDLAIRMASDRPPWEASGLVREELSVLHGNRAQALMSQQQWPEAAIDAELSVDLKRVGNVKGWYRRGQCLKEMGRIDEAADCVAQGLEFERAGPEKQSIGELETLQREIRKLLEKS